MNSNKPQSTQLLPGTQNSLYCMSDAVVHGIQLNVRVIIVGALSLSSLYLMTWTYHVFKALE